MNNLPQANQATTPAATPAQAATQAAPATKPARPKKAMDVLTAVRRCNIQLSKLTPEEAFKVLDLLRDHYTKVKASIESSNH